MEFAFHLKYQLSAEDSDRNDVVERLIETGCGDALIRTGQPGRLSLSFIRPAPNADAAVLGALHAVKRAVPSVRLIEVGPDLVGLTDVAELVGVSRQNMRKLMLTHASSFPPPMHEGNASSVWHLSHVLGWLKSRGHYSLDASVMDISRIAMQVNLAKEMLHMEGEHQALRNLLRAAVGGGVS
ncbi:helix-turn-helix transcriptional regulator [Roseateles amylovorans]|uniref:DNA-binding protein n=1 Tax=Roseateles amylovorans TaxID=2978473 RepID=A0ABY6B427_9BURK|nr:DNA-binding protein [Roseateles amylovorans]UXH80128.1 DNA-binding protein [Roseateles amylovorans]